MVRSGRVLVAWLLAGLMVLSVSVAVAAPGANGKAARNKARLRWSVTRVEQTLAPGQSTTITVDLVSSASLENVRLRIPGRLGRVASVKPSGRFNLTAGKAVQVTLTLASPANAARSQGGVVQVIAGRRNVPQSLKVLIKVPGDTGGDQGDATAKKNKSKAGKGNDRQGQGNAKAKGKHARGASDK